MMDASPFSQFFTGCALVGVPFVTLAAAVETALRLALRVRARHRLPTR